MSQRTPSKGRMLAVKSFVFLVTIGLAMAGNYVNNYNHGNNYPYTGNYVGLSNTQSSSGYRSSYGSAYQGVYRNTIVPHPYPYPVPVPAPTGRRIIAVRNNNGPFGNIFGLGGNGIFSKVLFHLNHFVFRAVDRRLC